jgi:hypothetical protein
MTALTIQAEPTQAEIHQAASILARLGPGFLPFDIFSQVARLCVMPILELVPLRRNHAGQLEILLFKRPGNDPHWANGLHTPGTVIRATDVGHELDAALIRLYDEDLTFRPKVEPIFVGTMFYKAARGSEFSTISYIDLSGMETPAGTWHLYDQLPGDAIPIQRDFIARAVQMFITKESEQ